MFTASISREQRWSPSTRLYSAPCQKTTISNTPLSEHNSHTWIESALTNHIPLRHSIKKCGPVIIQRLRLCVPKGLFTSNFLILYAFLILAVVVVSCSLVGSYRSFEGIYLLHLQGCGGGTSLRDFGGRQEDSMALPLSFSLSSTPQMSFSSPLAW
jgi:hypothetical protein